MLGLRMSNLSGFGEAAAAALNRDVSVDESTVTEQSGGGRKRQERRDANSEDESSKLVSTSGGNDLVRTHFVLFFQLCFHLYVLFIP